MEKIQAVQRSLSLRTGEFAWVGKVALGIMGCLPAYFMYEWWDTKQKVREYKGSIGDRVFMDIGIGNRYAGRIMLGLYSEQVPLTCENFLQLCKGYRLGDKVLGYRNTQFHLIRPGACLVGGDVLQGTGKSHGISIYGKSFPDENFDMQFLRDGDLAMINWGKNTNSSQFMITLSRQQQFYGHHVVFGTVVKGMRVVREMGELGTRVGRPAEPIRILQCGVVQDDVEEPPPPLDFKPTMGPVMTEDEFRSAQEEKRSIQQPG
mmetsp:Transcript_31958/g.62865  ORF Transcript_31958/g.62865 Transcript_31958/m.62865 type:complete len:262 (+) Transcript_31958:63-848(+)